MNIGILTFHSSYNFGANLQALAVHSLLKQKGCHPVVIDYRDPWQEEMYRAKVLPAQADVHERFVKTYLDTSPCFRCEKEVEEYCNEELDVIVVGSDQVFGISSRWEPRSLVRLLLTGTPSSSWGHVDDRLPVYYLPWARTALSGPRRVTIAACAMGTSYFFLGNALRKEARRALCNFDFVSVRDDWTGFVVRWLSNGKVQPEHCPDPVFCLNDCFSLPPEELPNVDVSNTILISAALDPAWLASFRTIAHDHGFRIGSLPDTLREYNFDDSDLQIRLPLSPLAWYSLLSQAAGYIGFRFHGLVSCVANQTPAISIEWSHRPRLLRMASRTYDLCSKAGATERYVPVNWLMRPHPDVVFEKLMDHSSQTAMNNYAQVAGSRLRDVFARLLAATSS